MAHPFRKNFPPAYNQKGANELSIGTDNGTPVYITESGKIRAKGFLDSNDDLEFSADGLGVVSRHKVGPYTRSEVTVNTKDNQKFISKISIYHTFTKIFKKIIGFTFSAAHWRFGLVSGLPKKLKNKIKSASNYPFVIEQRIGGNIYARPMIKGYWHKPYEVPVRLTVPNGIDSFSDIFVIKTGCFNYVNITGTGANLPKIRSGIREEKIVYVSPHNTIFTSGFISGTRNYQRYNATGGLATYSGASGIEHDLKVTGINVLSSMRFELPSGSIISGGNVYREMLGEIGSFRLVTGYSNLANSPLYQLYSGHRPLFTTGTNWDGIIPSGVPFKIEVWNFNATIVGYEGAIHVQPVNSDQFVVSTLKVGEGLSTESPAASLKNAIKHSNYQAQMSMEADLIDKGLMAKNSKYNKYTSFIERSNQAELKQDIVEIKFPEIEIP